MGKKVLYIQPLHPSGMDYLREKGYDVVVANTEDKAVLKEMVKDASAIISRLTVVDKEILDCGEKLECCAKHGVGVDNFDLAECNRRGLPICTTGTANSASVAEHAFFALGALAKRIVYLDKCMRMDPPHWKSRDEAGSVDLLGMTVGIVGIGRIGSYFGKLATAAGMKVLVYDPFAPKEFVESLGFTYVKEFNDLLPQVDAVTFHVPLSDATRDLLNKDNMKLMKKTAYVINFARGGVVNENDLYEALKDGTIKAAAVDAWAFEPPTPANTKMVTLENCIMSPHCGTFSEGSKVRMSMAVAEGVDAVLSGKVPENAFNKKEIYGTK